MSMADDAALAQKQEEIQQRRYAYETKKKQLEENYFKYKTLLDKQTELYNEQRLMINGYIGDFNYSPKEVVSEIKVMERDISSIKGYLHGADNALNDISQKLLEKYLELDERHYPTNEQIEELENAVNISSEIGYDIREMLSQNNPLQYKEIIESYKDTVSIHHETLKHESVRVLAGLDDIKKLGENIISKDRANLDMEYAAFKEAYRNETGEEYILDENHIIAGEYSALDIRLYEFVQIPEHIIATTKENMPEQWINKPVNDLVKRDHAQELARMMERTKVVINSMKEGLQYTQSLVSERYDISDRINKQLTSFENPQSSKSKFIDISQDNKIIKEFSVWKESGSFNELHSNYSFVASNTKLGLGDGYSDNLSKEEKKEALKSLVKTAMVRWGDDLQHKQFNGDPESRKLLGEVMRESGPELFKAAMSERAALYGNRIELMEQRMADHKSKSMNQSMSNFDKFFDNQPKKQPKEPAIDRVKGSLLTTAKKEFFNEQQPQRAIDRHTDQHRSDSLDDPKKEAKHDHSAQNSKESPAVRMARAIERVERGPQLKPVPEKPKDKEETRERGYSR